MTSGSGGCGRGVFESYRYFGLSVKDKLNSWTVMESIIGITGVTHAWLMSYVV